MPKFLGNMNITHQLRMSDVTNLRYPREIAFLVLSFIDFYFLVVIFRKRLNRYGTRMERKQ